MFLYSGDYAMNKIEKIAEKALQLMIVDITDNVFVVIQENRDLMQRYIEQVVANGKDDVNQTIGKYIKKRLNLTSLGRDDDPASSLISSYERHGLPR
jgi:hypothetical protein